MKKSGLFPIYFLSNKFFSIVFDFKDAKLKKIYRFATLVVNKLCFIDKRLKCRSLIETVC